MNLLLVDDEIYVLQGILTSIDKAYIGVENIYTASCYSQAVNIFMEQKIDLLLCDIEMPFGSGLDLVEWVKKEFYETECILLTCHTEFAYAQQAVKLNCLDYIVKPVETEVLNALLKKALNKIRDRRKESIYTEYGKVYLKNMSAEIEESDTSMRDVVEKVESYVLQNLEENLMVEEIAGNFYISVNHLNRLFKKKHNMTVGEYITDVRMKTAARLLETSKLSIAMVSAKTGYNNYSYFIKLFKKYYGITPKEYMLEYQKRQF